MPHLFICLLIGFITTSHAQIPVELFAGHQRSTVDIMFFKYFRKNDHKHSPWLFFNRNRASISYPLYGATLPPQFGFTEAVSYNHPILKGVAPVLVGQILNNGVYTKMGIQFASVQKRMTLFSWLVCELKSKPQLDYFLLFRYLPKLSSRTNLFTQIELVNSIPSSQDGLYSFTQRLRLGIQLKTYQFGIGTDMNQGGHKTMKKFYNLGGFIRHEF